MYNLNKNLVYEFDLRNTFQFSSYGSSAETRLATDSYDTPLLVHDKLAT